MRTRTARTGATLAAAAVLGLTASALAATTVVDYDGVPKGGDFQTAPYSENGITTTVVQGHYELYDDATGSGSDQAFNLDEQNPDSAEPPIPSKIRIMASPARTFDVVSLDVVNPADTVGEYTISAIGGTGGSIPAPLVAGPLDLSGNPAFQGITALVIAQSAPNACPTQDPCSHAFTFDDLTLKVVPEPGSCASLAAGGLALFALRRRRAR